MSEVFLALMSAACGSAKPVVIKRLCPELARYPEHVELFLDEARISLQMSHPNVIHAYESGQDGERHYLTLEYLEGQPLKHVFDGASVEGGLSLPLAFKIICDVLSALEYIHELQDIAGRPLAIVHRDVSPQNVFITYEGVVKVVDFGIAQFAGTHASKPSRDMKGRLAYMAPEQVAGLAVDRRADLYSVGGMLWELAVGKRLWLGMNEADITQHLLACKPMPLLPRNRGFPPGLAAICSHALAPRPEDRYADASQFLADLGELMTGSVPVQSRLLGDLMGRLFGSSRALTRAMIQQRLQGEGLFPGEEVTPESNDRQATGEYPATSRSSGRMEAVFDRSTNSGIATAGEEVTGVNLPWLRPMKKNSFVVTGLGVALFLVLLVLGVALRDYLSRRARPAHSTQRPSVATSVVAVPSALPANPPPPETPEHGQPPAQYTVQEPIVLDARLPKHAKTPPKSTSATRSMRLTERDFFDVAAKTVAPAANRAIDTDAFDVDLKTLHHAPRRVMDREDPYKP